MKLTEHIPAPQRMNSLHFNDSMIFRLALPSGQTSHVIIRTLFVLSSKVLSIRNHLPGGGEDPGHAGPEHTGEEAGLVWYHRTRWPLRPWTHPPPSLLLHPHQEEPLLLHPWAAAGHGDRPGYLLQVRVQYSPCTTCWSQSVFKF